MNCAHTVQFSILLVDVPLLFVAKVFGVDKELHITTLHAYKRNSLDCGWNIRAAMLGRQNSD